jgi:hypothetical protein
MYFNLRISSRVTQLLDITATFDTCILDWIVKGRPEARKIREAIVAGRVQAFYCETVVTLEGVQKKERREVFGRTRPLSRSSSTDKNTINITIGIEHYRPPLHAKHAKMIEDIEALGMRALRAPARMCGIRARDDQVTFFKPHATVAQLVACMDKVNALATEIGRRGVGYAIPVKLGLEQLTPEEIAKPTLWFAGLPRVDGTKKVKQAIAEWADGDAVAAHYGFGIDLFCTRDRSRNTSGPSVLDENNRSWLQSEYGIKFVSLDELADII